MKRVLITGASGFIGSNIHCLLKSYPDIECIGVGHTHAEQCGLRNGGDLRQEESWRNLLHDVKPDTLMLMAAVTTGAEDIQNKPEMHVHDNIVINAHAVACAHEYGVGHIVFPSSSVVYPSGDYATQESPMHYESIHQTYGGAAWMKICMEQMCQFYSGIGNMKTTIVRHANTYGPFDTFGRGSHMVAANIKRIAEASQNGHVTIWGTGNEKRDFIYITDLCNLLHAIVINNNNDGFHVYNAGWGLSHSVNTVVNAIILASGKNLSVQYDRNKPMMPTQPALNSCKAWRDFKWKPSTSLADGIERTYRWYNLKNAEVLRGL